MAAIFEFDSHDAGIPQIAKDVDIDLKGSSKFRSSDVSSPRGTVGPPQDNLGNLSAAFANTRISSKQGPAKGGLAFLIANSNSSSRVPSDAGDLAAERAAESGSRSAKKKKSKKRGKKGNNISTAGLEKPDFMTQNVPKKLPLANGVPTKAAEPDWSFMKIPTASSCSSRSSSPARSGLSSLLSQAHPGDIVSVIGSDTSNSEHGDPESVVAYEVALDEDYVNKEVDSRPTTRSGSPLGLPRKKMTASDFEPLKCLGKGSYGTVILVRHKATGRLYAQKQLKKASLVVHKKIIEQTKTERAILESVRHPFVVKLFYAFQDQEKLYLILEYAEGGELFLHLAESRMFSEDAAAFYLAQLVLALSHLHMNVGVVYRDLKPENCLLDADGQLLLTDFGLSKVRTDDSRCCSLLGTPEYMAPEVLIGDGEAEYGPEVDWWAVGVIACELLTGSPPFKGNTAEKVKQRIVKSNKLSLPFYLSADAKDLISKLLRKEPHKRLGHNMPEDLQIMKKHRFFRKIDWTKLERRELDPPIKPLVTDPELAENFSGEFTMLPLSPTVNEGGFAAYMEACQDGDEIPDDPFGGFSFVASKSVLEYSFLNGDW